MLFTFVRIKGKSSLVSVLCKRDENQNETIHILPLSFLKPYMQRMFNQIQVNF